MSQKTTLPHWWSKRGLSVEVNFKQGTWKDPGELRCLFWVEVGYQWRFIPTNFQNISNFNSVVVRVTLFSFRWQVWSKHWRILFPMFTRRMWDFISCLGCLNVWSSSNKSIWNETGVGGVEFLSIRWFASWGVMIALSEETNPWSPIRWLNYGNEWSVSFFSKADDIWCGSGFSERRSKIFRGRWLSLCMVTQ